jgi:hypothetical protein
MAMIRALSARLEIFGYNTGVTFRWQKMIDSSIVVTARLA